MPIHICIYMHMHIHIHVAIQNHLSFCSEVFRKVCPAECFAESFIRCSGPSNPTPHYTFKLLQFCQEMG